MTRRENQLLFVEVNADLYRASASVVHLLLCLHIV